jgi:starch-binding outer membrane protein, SusD/RagB family
LANQRASTKCGEARADMVSPATQAIAEELELVNVNILPTNTITNWRSIYRTINYCNTIIQLAPGVLPIDQTFTQAQLNGAISEALAIRALMYFYLVRSFRDVPLKLDATVSDQDIITPLAKTSGDSVLAQIVRDLKQAETGAVTSFGNRASDKGRVTKYTVNAILADVYLWMEKYTECVVECDKIINSGQFGLIANDGTWFNKLYVEGNSVESIFEFQFDVQRLNSFYNFFVGSIRHWSAAPRIIDDIYTVDLTNDLNKDIRADGASVRSSDYTIWKFVAANFNTLRNFNQSFAHWFVYRYAEVLMMKAEALNQLGRGVEAMTEVRKIRTRANALVTTNPIDSTSKTGIANYILDERAREFMFEGKRWYDLLRNAKRNNYQQLDLLTTAISFSVPANRLQSAQNKYQDFNSHYFPIYFYELQTNKALVQNPFYK